MAFESKRLFATTDGEKLFLLRMSALSLIRKDLVNMMRVKANSELFSIVCFLFYR